MFSNMKEIPAILNSDAFQIYTSRLARYAYLRGLRNDYNPLLAVESELIEMARSKFKECLFKNVKYDQMGAIKNSITSYVKLVSSEKVKKYEMDDEMKKSVYSFIQEEKVFDLFPVN